MKPKETLLNTVGNEDQKKGNGEKGDPAGEDHIGTGPDTPLRDDAFELDEETKIQRIRDHFRGIMETLGLDLNDDSLKGTPDRVARMYVKEVFKGLDPSNKPEVKVFENNYKYNEMLIEKDISIHSFCEHHFLPIIGKAHVGYISNGKVVGLSKINRVVQYFAQRPQVQERMTLQVINELKSALKTEDVAVLVESQHLCVSSRGVQDVNSTTVTAEYSGRFQENETTRREFLGYIHNNMNRK